MIKYIPPKREFQGFLNQDHYKQKLKEWGLSTAKEEFWYKEKDFQELVKINGYESYGISGEFNTVVIEFHDGIQTCIHPAYLKEMQQSSFGKENMWQESNQTVPEDETDLEIPVQDVVPEPEKVEGKKEERTKTKKIKLKLELPAEKVHFSAKVKQFAMTYNSFTEENDETVILEKVEIHQEPPILIEFAWCSYSKTLKKFELSIGDTLEFDGKITAKKLTKGKDAPAEYTFEVKVPYKINNPSKLVKQRNEH